jgi:hypothetical protein
MQFGKPAWLTWRLVALSGILLALLFGAVYIDAYCWWVEQERRSLFISIILSIYVAFFLLLPEAIIVRLFKFAAESTAADADDCPSRGELPLLLRLKQTGTLLTRSWRVRERGSKTADSTPDTSRVTEPRWHQAVSGGKGLDRLLWLKRSGAWKPHQPEAQQNRMSHYVAMRRFRLRWLLLGLLVALLLVPALWLIVGSGPHRVTRENFEKIQLGMTRHEIDALMHEDRPGRWPPIDNGSLLHGEMDAWEDMRSELGVPDSDGLGGWTYRDDDGSWLIPGPRIVVGFDIFGHASAKRYVVPVVQDYWNRIRRKIGW